MSGISFALGNLFINPVLQIHLDLPERVALLEPECKFTKLDVFFNFVFISKINDLPLQE